MRRLDGAGIVACSPNGQILATAGSGVLLQSLRDRSSIGSIAFAPDDSPVGALSLDGTVRVWQVSTCSRGAQPVLTFWTVGSHRLRGKQAGFLLSLLG